jgi:UDP-N-acetylglucosamine enolpyruvyl transferase
VSSKTGPATWRPARSLRTSRRARPPPQFLVEGGRPLSGTIRPSGNKNAALPIVAAALLTEQPVTLENVPRIRDLETLVELIASLGVEIEWTSATRCTCTPRR